MTLEERVAALELRVTEEARLRASVDGDVSDVSSAVKASRLLIQAVAITQMEHTSKLERHTDALARLEAGMATLIAMLTELMGREGGE